MLVSLFLAFHCFFVIAAAFLAFPAFKGLALPGISAVCLYFPASICFYTFLAFAVCFLLFWLFCFDLFCFTLRYNPSASYEQNSFIFCSLLDYDALVSCLFALQPEFLCLFILPCGSRHTGNTAGTMHCLVSKENNMTKTPGVPRQGALQTWMSCGYDRGTVHPQKLSKRRTLPLRGTGKGCSTILDLLPSHHLGMVLFGFFFALCLGICFFCGRGFSIAAPGEVESL